MDKIFISDKIKHVVLLHSEETEDAINAVLTSKYAAQKSFFLIKVDNKEDFDISWAKDLTYNLIEDTFVINFLDYLKRQQVFNMQFFRISLRHLVIIERNNTIENTNIFHGLTLFNIAFLFWNQSKPYFLINYSELNIIKQMNLMDFSEDSNIYDNLFLDQFTKKNLKHATLGFYPQNLSPQFVRVYNNMTNNFFYFGTDAYLFFLLGQLIGAETNCFLDQYSNYKPLQMNELSDHFKHDLISLELCNHSIFTETYYTGLMVQDDNFAYFRTFVYPHDNKKIVILVPNICCEVSLLRSLMLNIAIVIVWFAVVILVIVLRIYIQREKNLNPNKVVQIVVDTFCTAFTGISCIKINNRQVLILSLSVYSFVSSVLISGYIFTQHTVTEKRSTINSIEDLNKTDLDIYVEYTSNEFLQHVAER